MPLPFRLSRRSLLKAAARLGVGAGLAALGIGGERGRAQEESEEPYFRESATTLTLGNRFYEVDFDKRNGAITRIFDRRGGGVVSEGNADGSLWAIDQLIDFENWGTQERTDLASNDVPPSRFDYQWRKNDRTLELNYEVREQGYHAQVTVSVAVGDNRWFDLAARLDYLDGPRIDWFSFPHHLSFDADRISRALWPSMPGLMLKDSFFRERRWTEARYPGVNAFMDFIWFDVEGNTLALYAVHGTSPHWPAKMSLVHPVRKTRYIHRIAAAIEGAQEMHTPVFRCVVGADPLDVLRQVRVDNGYDQYPSLADKLGDVYATVLASTKVDAPMTPDGFLGLERELETFDPPVIIGLGDYLEQSFHFDDPDVWPPGDQYGGEEAYHQTMPLQQRDGNLVALWNDPMWWVPTSHTAEDFRRRGIDVNEVAVRLPDGSPILDSAFADYDGVTGWNAGLRASPADPRVIDRLDIINGMHSLANSDLGYWDEVGADPRIFDYHPAASSPIAFSQNWLDYVIRWKHLRLTTEEGWDRLAQAMYGFIGNTDWNAWFRRKRNEWGNGNWETYPAIPILWRDKTLAYDIRVRGMNYTVAEVAADIEKTIDTLYDLRYYLAFGYQMHSKIKVYWWRPELRLKQEEVNMFLDFGHHVTWHFADELLTDYTRTDEVSTSEFATFSVTAEWSVDHPVDVGPHGLVPGGVVAFAHDGSITGGVFRSYNGRALTEGEHYLIEQRKAQGVVLRQPMGPETHITLGTPDKASSNVKLAAFNRRDERLTSTSARVQDGEVRFQYERISTTTDERRSFEVSVSLGDTNRDDGLREVDLSWTTSVPEVRDGRACRREVQMTASEAQHGYIAFALDRDIFGPNGEAGVLVDVDWWDGGGLLGPKGDWLNLVYDRADSDPDMTFSHGLSGSAEAVNDQQWKTARFRLPRAVFRKRVWDSNADIGLVVPSGVCIGKVTVTNADELERRTVAYYTIHDPMQGETLTQGLHLRGWTDATQPIAELDLDGLGAIFDWDAEGERWRMYSPHVPASANTLDRLEQGRAYYVRVANGRTLHWPEAPYGGVGFHLQPGRNLVCWLGTPDKTLTDAIAPLRGMKAEPLVSVQIDGQTYDMKESRQATEPLAYGQALWVEIDAVGPTRWLQF